MGSNPVLHKVETRMKVNISGQQIDEPEPSYISTTQAQQMQAQMNTMNMVGQPSADGLAKSREKSKRKVVGASTIRTLIKSAATRD